MNSTQTPAGWYPDQTGSLRFWDGEQWTSFVHAASPITVKVDKSQTLSFGNVLLALMIIGMALIFLFAIIPSFVHA